MELGCALESTVEVDYVPPTLVTDGRIPHLCPPEGTSGSPDSSLCELCSSTMTRRSFETVLHGYNGATELSGVVTMSH